MLNIKHRQGDNFNLEIDISAVTQFDVEGWTAYLTMKLDYEQTTPDAQTETLITASDITNGYITLSIPAADMKLEQGKYYFDIQLSEPSSVGEAPNIITIAPSKEEWKQDRIEIIPEITIKE